MLCRSSHPWRVKLFRAGGVGGVRQWVTESESVMEDIVERESYMRTVATFLCSTYHLPDVKRFQYVDGEIDQNSRLKRVSDKLGDLPSIWFPMSLKRLHFQSQIQIPDLDNDACNISRRADILILTWLSRWTQCRSHPTRISPHQVGLSSHRVDLCRTPPLKNLILDIASFTHLCRLMEPHVPKPSKLCSGPNPCRWRSLCCRLVFLFFSLSLLRFFPFLPFSLTHSHI